MAAPPKVHYFVFDVESVANGELVSRVRYPGLQLAPEEAIARYRAELMEKQGTDFIPYTYQIPVSLVVAKLRRDYALDEIVALDEPHYRPHVITDYFWRGWEIYGKPTFVTFNGRSFDLPLMELAAFQYGVSAGAWFQEGGRAYEQPRNRYNSTAHLDLQDLLSNYGATRVHGGLNLAATILGRPGKMDVQGDMVQDMYLAGRLAEINDYCRCDVLDTYFVFLRTRVLTGRLTLEAEQELVQSTKNWLQEQAEVHRAYRLYLEHWRDWDNPWSAGGAAADPPTTGLADAPA